MTRMPTRSPRPLSPALDAVRADAVARAPEEACGIVVQGPDGLRVCPAPNASSTPTLAFELPLPWLLPRLEGVTLRG